MNATSKKEETYKRIEEEEKERLAAGKAGEEAEPEAEEETPEAEEEAEPEAEEETPEAEEGEKEPE